MKFRHIAFALSLFAFSAAATAETGYVGAGAGALMSTNGCVMSVNETQFPECGKAEAPKAEAPKPVVKTIVDCAKCAAMKKKK